jgi:hypothetical protein
MCIPPITTATRARGAGFQAHVTWDNLSAGLLNLVIVQLVLVCLARLAEQPFWVAALALS